MISVNEVTIIGNLTKDPELKALPTGSSVVNISIATNRSWKDQNGQRQEQVEFHNVIAFGKTADTIAQYFKKGQQMYLKGRLQTRSWDDVETQKKMYRTEIVLDTFQFGVDPNRSKSEYTNTDTSKPTKDYGRYEIDYRGYTRYGVDDIDPNDIPF